jgi:prepilin-type processing-associated H-X9-DG protein
MNEMNLIGNHAFSRLHVKVAMSKRHTEYVNSALADWHVQSYLSPGRQRKPRISEVISSILI